LSGGCRTERKQHNRDSPETKQKAKQDAEFEERGFGSGFLFHNDGGTRCPQRVGNAAMPPVFRCVPRERKQMPAPSAMAIVLRTRRSTLAGDIGV
jgi:hypothetical protein